jgi:hypothetical protein
MHISVTMYENIRTFAVTIVDLARWIPVPVSVALVAARIGSRRPAGRPTPVKQIRTSGPVIQIPFRPVFFHRQVGPEMESPSPAAHTPSTTALPAAIADADVTQATWTWTGPTNTYLMYTCEPRSTVDSEQPRSGVTRQDQCSSKTFLLIIK